MNQLELRRVAIENLRKFYQVDLSDENFVAQESTQFEDTSMEIVAFRKENSKFSAGFYSESQEIFTVNSLRLSREEIKFSTVNVEDGSEISNSMPIEGNCNEGESCTGCHYRVMKEIISQDGDSQAACDLLGPVCDFQVYATAFVHCLVQH